MSVWSRARAITASIRPPIPTGRAGRWTRARPPSRPRSRPRTMVPTSFSKNKPGVPGPLTLKAWRGSRVPPVRYRSRPRWSPCGAGRPAPVIPPGSERRSERPDRDLGGCRQQRLDLRVEAAERDRRAGHVQRRAVVADVVPPDVDPALRQLLVRVPVEQVQLTDRSAAQPVDHERHVVTAAEGQVGDDRLEQLIDDLVGAGQLLAAASRLAVDTDAHL